MQIKKCEHCGGSAQHQQAWLPTSMHEYIQCEQCGMRTGNCDSPQEAADIWNGRYEQNPSEADRWLNEAIGQRARADKSEEMVAFLKEQLARVANFNCDWDMLKACQESWRELAAEHNKLKKEYDQLTEALEQAKRMLDYAGKLQ